MSECVNKFFICDGEVKECSKFDSLLRFEGITIYEVIRVIDRVPLFIEQHLSRLVNSSRLAKVQLKYTDSEIINQIRLLIKQNDVINGNIKIIFNYSSDILSCIYFIKHSYPTEKMYREGVETILYHSERTNPNIKAVNKAFRENVEAKIQEAKVYEAILVDRNGYITEGSKSNIFVIKDNKILTAPLKDVLPGVTRERVISISKKLGFNIHEENIHYEDLYCMDALFITGTSPKLLPISKVEDKIINSTKNTILNRLMLEYDLLINEYIVNNEYN